MSLQAWLDAEIASAKSQLWPVCIDADTAYDRTMYDRGYLAALERVAERLRDEELTHGQR